MSVPLKVVECLPVDCTRSASQVLRSPRLKLVPCTMLVLRSLRSTLCPIRGASGTGHKRGPLLALPSADTMASFSSAPGGWMIVNDASRCGRTSESMMARGICSTRQTSMRAWTVVICMTGDGDCDEVGNCGDIRLEPPWPLSGSHVPVLIHVKEAETKNNDGSFNEEARVREMTRGEARRFGILIDVYPWTRIRQWRSKIEDVRRLYL